MLALAWLAAWDSGGRNPRWRVALWRSTVVGLAVVPVLSACPPIVTYQHVTGERKSVESRSTESHPASVRSTEISAARAVRPAPALVPVRERIDAIRPAPSLAPSVVTDSESARLLRSPRNSVGMLESTRGCGQSGWPASFDTQGGFILENCVTGPTIITIQAEGFAPLTKDLRIEERTAPVEIRMTELGSVLRGRVIDAKGKPVTGVRVVANGWHGYRSIEFRTTTNDDGRFEWRSAPKDAVEYSIGRADYMWVNPITGSVGA